MTIEKNMRLTWFSDRKWAKSERLTDSELLMIEKLLPMDDPRSRKLLAQATQAPYVERTLTARNKYQAVIPFVVDSSNLIELDTDTQSPPMEVLLFPSSQAARFQLHLLRGGFLHRLTGELLRCSDWTKDWVVDERSFRTSVGDARRWLPAEPSRDIRVRIVDQLERWCKLPQGSLQKYPEDQLRVFAPCTDAELDSLESREGLSIPSEYRAFLRITNGIDVVGRKAYIIAGSLDLRKVSLSGASMWLITDLSPFGVVLMRSGDVTAEIMLAKCNGTEIQAISSLSHYLVDSIRLLDQGDPKRHQ